MDLRTEELIGDLGNDLDHVRKAAVLRLGLTGRPEVLPYLERMVSDPAPGVQYFARRYVDELGRRVAPGSMPVPALSADEVLALLESPDPEARGKAGAAAVRHRDQRLLEALLGALEREDDVRVIATLVKAIGHYRDPRVTGRIVELLHHADSRVRSNCVDTARELEDQTLLDEVSLLATDVAGRVRGSVALLLARRSPEQAARILSQMIDSDLIWMKDSAVFVMYQLCQPWCVPLLRRVIARPNEDVKLIDRALFVIRQVELHPAGTAHGRLAPEPAAEPRPAPATPDVPPSATTCDDVELRGLGVLTCRLLASGRVVDAGLAGRVTEIERLSDELDRGGALEALLDRRDRLMEELGRTAREARGMDMPELAAAARDYRKIDADVVSGHVHLAPSTRPAGSVGRLMGALLLASLVLAVLVVYVAAGT